MQPQEIAKREDHGIAENVPPVASKRRGRPPKRVSVVAPTEDNSSKRTKVFGRVSLPPIDPKTTSHQPAAPALPDTQEHPSGASIVPVKRGRGRPRKDGSVRLPPPPKLEPKTETRTEAQGPSTRTRASTGAVSDILPSATASQAQAKESAIPANGTKEPSAPAIAPPAKSGSPSPVPTRRAARRINYTEESGSDRSDPKEYGVMRAPTRIYPWGYYVDEEGNPLSEEAI